VSDVAISIRGLRKSYGDVEAVRGIDLEVQAGQVFAFLGPNGAGKTTTVEILEGYREPSSGTVEVLGIDPQKADRAWRERIGIVPQACNVPSYLSVRESLSLYGGYYAAPRPVDDVIELVGLEGKADTRSEKLSGGQQRRLDVGLALIGDPDLLFLDEPTTGFDPQARRQAWDVLSNLRELGKTIFLTTHYMEEAQRLADTVAILRRGEIVGEGRPDEIGDREHQPATVRFRLPSGIGPADLPGTFHGAEVVSGVGTADDDGGLVALQTPDPTRALNELTGWALDRNLALEGLEVNRPSLEDVYLRLTEQEVR